VLEENLESGAHGAALSKRERPYDEVRGGGGFRNRDYAARPLATGRIRAVVLVCLPQSEWEGLQERRGCNIRELVRLGFDSQFSEVIVLAPRAGPVAGEQAGVSTCGLSIKLDGQMVDGDIDVGVEEALHVQGACEQGGLGKIFVLRKGEERAVEVPAWNKDHGMLAGVRAKRKATPALPQHDPWGVLSRVVILPLQGSP